MLAIQLLSSALIGALLVNAAPADTDSLSNVVTRSRVDAYLFGVDIEDTDDEIDKALNVSTDELEAAHPYHKVTPVPMEGWKKVALPFADRPNVKAPRPALTSRAVTALSAAGIAAFKPFTHYASTAYCLPAVTKTWKCGANCNKNPTFKPTASGGNGGSQQFWYVGFDPTLKTVVVGRQGTDFSKILAVITDANVILRPLEAASFPGVPAGVKVHDGFADAQARTGPLILAAVKKTMVTHAIKRVTVVGHSLGGALALLDGLYLKLNLPSTTVIRTITYSSPRVGNPEFANFIDKAGINISRIGNKNDPVPILPGRFLGYRHVSGEVHLTSSTTWRTCTGQENEDVKCHTGDVPNILVSEAGDHGGPFDGVSMNC